LGRIHPFTPGVLSGEEEGLEDAQPRVPLNADTLLQHLKNKNIDEYVYL